MNNQKKRKRLQRLQMAELAIKWDMTGGELATKSSCVGPSGWSAWLDNPFYPSIGLQISTKPSRPSPPTGSASRRRKP